LAIGNSHSADLAGWASRIAFGDLPHDVVEATRLRVMDVIGLALAGAESDFGRSTREAAIAMSPPGPCRVWGTGDRLGATMAAFANGAGAQALEYDDTHNESIVHMSSPAVAAALALSEIGDSAGLVSGRDLITAIAVSNEISCRVGSVSAGQFHRLGFHPTGLFAPFGVCYLAGRLLGLDAEAMTRAAGICGSFAAGLLQCWVDGTQTKFLHPGWAAPTVSAPGGTAGARRSSRFRPRTCCIPTSTRCGASGAGTASPRPTWSGLIARSRASSCRSSASRPRRSSPRRPIHTGA
jgi:2-methylcitrate dehydratase PrpD